MQEIQEIQGQHSWGEKKGKQNKTDALKWLMERYIWSLVFEGDLDLQHSYQGSDCQAVETGPRAVGLNGVVLSVQMQYSSLKIMCMHSIIRPITEINNIVLPISLLTPSQQQISSQTWGTDMKNGTQMLRIFPLNILMDSVLVFC